MGGSRARSSPEAWGAAGVANANAQINAPNNKQPRGRGRYECDVASGEKGTKRRDKKAASCINF